MKTLALFLLLFFLLSCSSGGNLKTSYGMKLISYPNLNLCKGKYNVNRWTNCTGFVNYKNDDTYQGPFFNGKAHGEGMYTWPNGDTFFGTFVNNTYTKGIYKWKSGNMYIGEFKPFMKNSKTVYNKHGLGIFKGRNEIYIGDFENNNYHGVGLKKHGYRKNTISEGVFKKGFFYNKKDVDYKIRQVKDYLRNYINKDQDIKKFVDSEIDVKNRTRNKYIAEKSDLLRQKEKDYREFSQSLSLSNSIEKIKKNFFTKFSNCSSKKQDFCVRKIKFSNGVGEGLIKNRKLNGIGFFKNKNGEEAYVGQFKNNNYDGLGIYFYKDNWIYDGQFKNGKKMGYGTMYFNKKVSKSGYWVDGKFKNKINFPISFYASSLLDKADPLFSNNTLAQNKTIRELKEELNKLKRENSNRLRRIKLDKVEPTINVFPKIDEEIVSLDGNINDDVGVSELIINGIEVGFEESGNFKTKLYIPRSGLNIKITAFDLNGNKNSKELFVNRKPIQNFKKVKFTKLDPTQFKVKKNNNSLAVIVGISNYKDIPSKAMFADNDAKVFYDYAKFKLGIPDENIKELINSRAEESDILLALKEWLRLNSVNNKSNIYLFFAGHGLASQDGKEKYLLPYDGRPELLDKTAVLLKELINDISILKPKKVFIFLDTCYSGLSRTEESLISARPVVLKATDDYLPENFTLFSASKHDQISRPLNETKHGMFSYFLMKGMEGFADLNNDKRITTNELHQYVKTNVNKFSLGKQTPQLFGNSETILVNF